MNNSKGSIQLTTPKSSWQTQQLRGEILGALKKIDSWNKHSLSSSKSCDIKPVD